MVDRTTNTTFFVSTVPDKITFRSNLSNADTFTLPYGGAFAVLGLNSEDDTNALATATVSGSVVTLGLRDDTNAAVDVDTDIVGEVLLTSQ